MHHVTRCAHAVLLVLATLGGGVAARAAAPGPPSPEPRDPKDADARPGDAGARPGGADDPMDDPEGRAAWELRVRSYPDEAPPPGAPAAAAGEYMRRRTALHLARAR